MRERGIIFSTEMVRAILNGRKTQTRRVIKNICIYSIKTDKDGMILWRSGPAGSYKKGFPGDDLRDACPYGQSGDRLWVRGSYFFPRSYPHITLEITGVRVERVQDISVKDVEAEGIDIVSKLPHPLSLTSKKSRENLDGLVLTIARGLYGNLWDSLNVKRGFGWDTNPWVWVIEFKRIEKGRNP